MQEGGETFLAQMAGRNKLQSLEEIEQSLHLSGLVKMFNTRATGPLTHTPDTSFKLIYRSTSELCTAWDRKSEYEAQGLPGWPQEEREGFNIEIYDHEERIIAGLTYLQKELGGFYIAGTNTLGDIEDRVLPLSERSPEVRNVLLKINECRSQGYFGPIPGFPT